MPGLKDVEFVQVSSGRTKKRIQKFPVLKTSCRPNRSGEQVVKSVPGLATRTRIPIRLLPKSLQSAERKLIMKSFPAALIKDLDATLVAGAVAAKLSPLTIDYRLIPADWLKPTKCLDTTVTLRIETRVKKVAIRATKVWIDGPDVWQPGETLVEYEVEAPEEFVFIRKAKHNPKCCEDAPEFERFEASGSFLAGSVGLKAALKKIDAKVEAEAKKAKALAELMPK